MLGKQTDTYEEHETMRSRLKAFLMSLFPETAQYDLIHVRQCIRVRKPLRAALGPRGARRFALIEPWRRVFKRTADSRYSVAVTTLTSAMPIEMECRQGSSDRDVILQIFVEREYECLANLGPVHYIVDAGANIGCSSVWFMASFPDATIVAIEPDSSNYEQLIRNTSAYGNRIECVRKALWHENTRLDWNPEPFRDGREWARRVQPSGGGSQGEVDAISMHSIVDAMPPRMVDVLKLDIEGAEEEVFQTGVDEWLPSVRAVVIELHSDEADQVVSRWFPPAEFSREQSGELTIFRRK